MALNFPLSPTIGDTYTSEIGVTYRWNGYGWSTTVTATDQAFSNIDSDIDKLANSISVFNSDNDSDNSFLIKRINNNDSDITIEKHDRMAFDSDADVRLTQIEVDLVAMAIALG